MSRCSEWFGDRRHCGCPEPTAATDPHEEIASLKRSIRDLEADCDSYRKTLAVIDERANATVRDLAWGRNAIRFLRERGLEREFSDWCGGWPVPASNMEICDACDGSGFGVADTRCGKCGGCGGIRSTGRALTDLREEMRSKARGGS